MWAAEGDGYGKGKDWPEPLNVGPGTGTNERMGDDGERKGVGVVWFQSVSQVVHPYA